jgi:uncharacterized membrane protein YoaK (UPF0700 family)
MSETSGKDAAFGISIGLAFIGGYADASGYLLARTLTGHLTGNCVLAAVSAASGDWYLTLDRVLAVIVFLAGILLNLIVNRLFGVPLRQHLLVIAMVMETLLFLSACLLLFNRATHELFIVCMCLALGIQNGALNKTKGISVHSTYMTGMVTTLMEKGFDHYCSNRSPKEDPSKDATPLAIQILASMWTSFIFGAVTGAVMVSLFRGIGLLGIVLTLIVLIVAEMKKKSSISCRSA